MKKAARRKNMLATGLTVYLRTPIADDCDEFIRLTQASVRLYQNLASAITTQKQFAEYIKQCSKSDFEGLLVCRKKDHVILGSINLSQISRGGFKSAYLGYQIGAPFAGQGFMTEALRLVLNYAFKHMKLHRLEANIQPGNNPSIALVRRAGFTKEGYSRKYLKISGQ